VPGIHYDEVRAQIALADVLDLLDFVPCESSGDQVRGPCPVHHSTSPSSRSFSADMKRHIYNCFKCGSSGNQLDLYTAVTRLGLFEATVRLCEQLHREIPWILSGTSARPCHTKRIAHDQPCSREVGASPAGGQA
jgi:DNA primase